MAQDSCMDKKALDGSEATKGAGWLWVTNGAGWLWRMKDADDCGGQMAQDGRSSKWCRMVLGRFVQSPGQMANPGCGVQWHKTVVGRFWDG